MCSEFVGIHFPDLDSFQRSQTRRISGTIAVQICGLLVEVKSKLLRIVCVVYPMGQLVGESEVLWSNPFLKQRFVSDIEHDASANRFQLSEDDSAGRIVYLVPKDLESIRLFNDQLNRHR